jgi:predicted anti-sigma-YlaC factor YlaD
MNWMYSCKQVARLLSQRLDEPLGMFERIRLSVHLSMCDDCRHVAQQLEGVQALSRDLFSEDLAVDENLEPSGPSGNRCSPPNQPE